jgi:hypothetical protein
VQPLRIDSGDFALVIGINEYCGGLDDLKGPPHDAEEFVDWLNRDYSSANIHDGNLIKKVNFQNFTSLRGAVIEITMKAQLRGGRRLYIFYAGHGFGTDFGNVGILTSDYVPDWTGGSLDLIKTVNWITMAGWFKEVVVFMDCCRTYDNRITAEPVLQPTSQDGSREPAIHFYCLACGLGETTFEREYSGKVRGRFSIDLIHALNGNAEGAVDADGCVTAYSLKKHLTEKLKIPRYEPPGDHHPNLKNIVLAKGFKPRLRPLEVILTEPHKGFSVFNGGTLELLRWQRERKGDSVVVLREGDPLGVIVAVPELSTFNQSHIQRYQAIFPDVNRVEI